MNTGSVKHIAVALLASTVLTFVSCRKDAETPRPVPENGDAISFVVSEAKPFATKAGDAVPESYYDKIFSTDSLDVYLQVSESDYCSEVATKGTPYSETNKIASFHVTAFQFPNVGTPFFSLSDLTFDGTNAVGTDNYWPITTDPTKLSFFGYAKSNANGTFKKASDSDETLPEFSVTTGAEGFETLTGSFWYKLPETNTATDAVTHPDLAFAIAPNKTNDHNPVDLTFYHALSALTFSVGTVPGNLTIDKIEFINIYSSGSCEYEYTTAPSGIAFDWTFNGADQRADYTQTFNKDLFTEPATPLPEDTGINTTEQTFMMIPQTFSEETTLVNIHISFEERKYTIERKLKDITPVWEAGKQYTFKISSPEEVQVDVTDEIVMDGTFPVKQNLQIKNNGIADAFIRVALTGAWVIEETIESETVQFIVADWKNSGAATDDGIFDWGGGSKPVTGSANSNNWRLGSDNYYYYMKRVKAGETVEPLFNSYKLTAASPMGGAYLEFNIVAQGVRCEDGEHLFPAEIWTELQSL